MQIIVTIDFKIFIDNSSFIIFTNTRGAKRCDEVNKKSLALLVVIKYFSSLKFLNRHF